MWAGPPLPCCHWLLGLLSTYDHLFIYAWLTEYDKAVPVCRLIYYMVFGPTWVCCQTSRRLVHPFLQGSRSRLTHTDHSTQLDRELRTQVSNTSVSASLIYTIVNKQYHFMSSSDWFLVPIRSAVRSNLTNWCRQNLSKRALNALTVQASMTELVGKLAASWS